MAFNWQSGGDVRLNPSETGTDALHKGQTPAVAFTASEMANSYAWESDQYPTLNAQTPNDTSNIQYGIRQGMAVRRLTPTECLRLQGFPDDWLGVPNEPPGSARYAACGDAVTVNVAEWLGRRLMEAR